MGKRISSKSAQLIKKHKYILDKLSKSKAKDRKTILLNAPSTLYTVLDTIFKMLANDQLDLSQSHKAKIKKHRRLIRSTSKLNAKAIKTKLVRQRGGSLPKILATILPVVGSIIKAFI